MNKYTMYRITTAIILFVTVAYTAMAQSYAPFYDAPKESYVKSMKQVLEDLHSRKWDKAKKGYQKIEEKSAAAEMKNPDYSNTQMEALFPLPQVAMTVLLSTEPTAAGEEAFLSPDYSKAYSLLKQALAYKEKEQLNTFLLTPSININLNMLQDRIEKQLCQKAVAENSEAAYDAIIDSLLPQSLRIQEMKMQREDLVFGIVNASPTEAECVRFLEKYADAQVHHKASISRALDSLRFTALDGTIKGYERYIAKYPESKYLKRAKDTLEVLEYKNVKNTAASCRAFMEKYPSSRYVMEIKKRLYEYAYKEAIAAGTGEAYQQYCKEFPYDLHYQEIFDSLLCRTVTAIYDTLFAGGTPDKAQVLSSAFCQAVTNREAAEQQLIAKSMIPPRRRDLWTGVARQPVAKDAVDTFSHPFQSIEVVGYDLMSKTQATVHARLLAPATDGKEALQMGIDFFFIFEGSDLKIDDIRLDNGGYSQRKSLG